jgi:hypothetical protein
LAIPILLSHLLGHRVHATPNLALVVLFHPSPLVSQEDLLAAFQYQWIFTVPNKWYFFHISPPLA